MVAIDVASDDGAAGLTWVLALVNDKTVDDAALPSVVRAVTFTTTPSLRQIDQDNDGGIFVHNTAHVNLQGVPSNQTGARDWHLMLVVKDAAAGQIDLLGYDTYEV